MFSRKDLDLLSLWSSTSKFGHYMLSLQVKEQQDFSFCVTQKKVRHIGLELHNDYSKCSLKG